MSDIYFIQVNGTGGFFEETADMLTQKAQELDVEEDTNIIVVPEEIEPLNQDEAREYLEQMADALDVEVVENEESG